MLNSGPGRNLEGTLCFLALTKRRAKVSSLVRYRSPFKERRHDCNLLHLDLHGLRLFAVGAGIQEIETPRRNGSPGEASNGCSDEEGAQSCYVMPKLLAS